MIHDNSTRYGTVSRLFHWGVGLLFITLLGVGLYMSAMDNGPAKMSLYGLHKATGFVVLFLVAARAVWRARHGFLSLPDNTPKIIQLAARSNMFLLYFCMFAMPLSGLLMSLLGGYPVNIYGLFTIPAITSEPTPAGGFFYNMHEITATIVMVALGLHILGSLYHHFVRKDNVLRRMV